MMGNYVKCPCCDLNYIRGDEKICVVCSPKMRGKLISDAVVSLDTFIQAQRKASNDRQESMAAFRAMRYNRRCE